MEEKERMLCVLCLVLLVSCTPSTGTDWVKSWKETTPLMVPRTAAGAVAAQGSLYVIGGARGGEGTRTFLESVERGEILPDGGIQAWKEVSPLTTARGFLATVEANGSLYAIGGANFHGLLATVERAKILEDGSLGPWTPTTSLTTPRRAPAAVVHGGYIYVIGGYNGVFLQTVERAKILEGGDLSPWETVSSRLTTDRYIHGAALYRNAVYVVGGHNRADGSPKQGAEWALLTPEGELGQWTSTLSSPLTPRFLSPTIAAGGYLYIIGGYNGQYLRTVERARISEEGGLGPWMFTTPLPSPKEGAAVAASHGFLYAIGGSNKGVYLSTVEFASLGPDGDLGHQPTSERHSREEN